MTTIARDTFRADELPGGLTSQVGRIGPSDMFVVEARKLSSDEMAQLAGLQTKVQAGIDQLDVGLGIEGDQVFARLRAKYFTDR